MGEFTHARYERLKVIYDRAVEKKEVELEFEDRTYLVAFVKYVVDYLVKNFYNGSPVSS